MRLVVICLLLGVGAPVAAQHPHISQSESEEVHFQNGDLALAGLWFVPPGAGPFPSAVIIHGSGPSTRENHWEHSVIDVLLGEGVAVLLPDKRGSGASGGDWRTSNFDDLAEDALAAVNFLQSQPDVREEAIGLVGLSQGGRVAPVAASKSEAVSFVVNLSGSATGFGEQVNWEMYHTFREAGLNDQSIQQALALQVAAEKYVKREIDWESYQAVLERARQSPWAEVANGFPDSPDSWEWTFFRGVIDFDPVSYWRSVDQPVLVAYGETDSNMPVIRSAYRLTRTFTEEGHSDWTLRIFPRTGHALWDPESADSHHPRLHPDFVEVLRDWMRSEIPLN